MSFLVEAHQQTRSEYLYSHRIITVSPSANKIISNHEGRNVDEIEHNYNNYWANEGLGDPLITSFKLNKLIK